MDIPFSTVFELLKSEPGHGLLQSGLLFMIWMSTRGLKKEVQELKETLTKMEIGYGVRIGSIENHLETHAERLDLLEGKKK